MDRTKPTITKNNWTIKRVIYYVFFYLILSIIMSINSIIIDDAQTKAKRIAPDKVQLDLFVKTEPNMDVRLYINGQLFQNLMSDINWSIEENMIIADAWHATITLKLENIAQWTKDAMESAMIQFKLSIIEEKVEAIKLVTLNWLNLLSDECKQYIDDFDIILAAVKQNGLELQYASDDMKNNQDIVLAAVRQNYKALEFASYSLRGNRTIVLEAMKSDWYAFQYATLRNDYDVAMKAVVKCWAFLASLSKDLQDNNAIVLAAVQKEWRALNRASDMLKNDHGIVLAAVQQDCNALKYASDRLKKDFSIFNAAVENYWNPIYARQDSFYNFTDRVYNSRYSPFSDFDYCVSSYSLWSHNDNKFLVLLCLSSESFKRNSYAKDTYFNRKNSPTLVVGGQMTINTKL